MKKKAYPYLIPAIVGAAALLCGVIVWRAEIYRVTFLNTRGALCVVIGTGLLTIFLMSIVFAKGNLKGKPISDYLKACLGAVLLSYPVAVFIVITAAWMLDGEQSAWSEPYRYSSGGRHSCEGAVVNEPELKNEIRVCQPLGNYSSDNILYVEKRSNALGIVVLWAITRP